LISNYRARIWKAIKRGDKAKQTVKLIGCPIEELKRHLESKFLDGMSWDNYGEWHIDHIKPCSKFDLTKETQQLKCFNYKNLQPLWAKQNRLKSAKWRMVRI
jgi:metal-dependent amidase/aminoacylase/carboxypeptidase family protein